MKLGGGREVAGGVSDVEESNHLRVDRGAADGVGPTLELSVVAGDVAGMSFLSSLRGEAGETREMRTVLGAPGLWVCLPARGVWVTVCRKPGGGSGEVFHLASI